MAWAVSAAASLDALITRAARARPERAAVSDPKTTLNYAELEQRVQQAAFQLVRAGVLPGDRVAIYAPKNVATAVALLGALRAGAAYVPIDPGAPPARAAWVMQHCGASAMVLAGRPQARWNQEFAEQAPPSAAKLVTLSLDDGAPVPLPKNRQLAYILYTSGSTGTPKGVAITHRQSLAFVAPACERFEATETDVFAAHAPFNFDLSIIDLFCSLYVGAQTVLVPETWVAFPKKIVQQLNTSAVTVWNSVPSALVQLLQRGGLSDHELPALRLVMFAGEPIANHDLKALMQALPKAQFLNVYGQTEANSSLVQDVSRPPQDPLPLGQALASMEVLLLGDDGKLIEEDGVEGELLVVSGAVAQGYYGDPKKSAEVFVPDPRGGAGRAYRTHDRALRLADGSFVFKGRRDRAVKVRGFRVELSEVEANLRKTFGCPAACLAVAHADEGHRLFGFLAEPVPDDARTKLAQLLPAYMLPAALEHVHPWPRTATGKTDTKRLRPRAEALAREA